MAAEHRHLDVVQALLAAKADANIGDNNGITPLHETAAKGYKDIAVLLLANGASVNQQDKTGHTPLAWAMHFDHNDVVELLQQHDGHE
jgi:ankyrin repeat protein